MNPFPPCDRRILITLDFPPVQGGIQRYLDGIVRHTFTDNDLVIAPGKVSPADTARYPCRIVRVGTPPRFLYGKLLLIALFWRLLPELAAHRRKKTVIIAGNIYPAIIAQFCSRIMNVPWCCFTYGTELAITSRTFPLRTKLWRYLLAKARPVYYLSTITSTLLRLYGDFPDSVRLPPRIDLPPDTPGTPDVRTAETMHLLSVGRLVAHKGHQTIIDALALSPDRHHLHCTIAGSGPCHASLAHSINLHALEKTVTIATGLDDTELARRYRTSDIFIFPSIDTPQAVEGFGIVLLEAIAHHCAVIASDCAAAREVLDWSSPCALFFKAGDAENLAETLSSLRSDATLRKTLTDNAYALLRERYVW